MNIVPTKLRYFHDRGLPIRGVIHVGMSWGEEIADYLALGATHVIGFEPLKEAFAEADKFYFGDKRVHLVNYGLGNDNGYKDIHRIHDPHPMPGHPVGTGGSSFLRDVNALPDGCTVTDVPVYMRRFADWLHDRPDTLIEDYNALVIDVQGMELDVLKGFGDLLRYFDCANIECSRVPVYEGEAPAHEVIAYMNQQGFQAVTPIEDHNDILFQR